MNYSLKYIKKLANLIPTTSNESIISVLTNLGFEVESAKVFVEGSKLVIGTITLIEPHPNADRLKILKVDIGSKNIQIVTGAKNILVGKQVIVCLPGAKCNGVEYKTIKLRDVESNGMLASLEELGISPQYLPDSSKEGIELLEPKYKNGNNALTSLGLDDTIINIDILSNRGDAHGYHFIATELSAYFDTKVDYSYPKLIPSFKTKITAIKGLSNHMSFFEAKMLKGESDFTSKILLIKSKIKPINKTVDLTNMALLLFGQTVHAYDKDLIGNKFECKLFTGKVKTINDIEIKLENNLTIINDNKPVSVAGVIGLKNSMISNNTQNVVFEIANFNPEYIRSTSQKTKIDNITTIRNSKSNSLNVIPLTINFLTGYFEHFSNTVNEYIPKHTTIVVEDNQLINYAGFDITKNIKYKNVLKFLTQLGYVINDNKYTIPFYRYDITNQFDIIEDIFRAYGYNNIPSIQPKVHSSLISHTDSIRTSLIHQNYSEVITYSLQDEKSNVFNPYKLKRNIKILNPLSEKRIVYRHTLINSMAEVANKNEKYKIEKFSIFEVGYIHGYMADKHIAMISTIKSLNDMKTDILTLLNHFGKVEFKRTSYEYLHEGLTADIFLNNNYVGFVGKFRPSYKKHNFLISEIKLPNKIKLHQESKPINYQQLIARDWTVILDTQEDIAKEVELLRQKINITYLHYVGTYKKNDSQKAVTFKIYLDKNNAKIFDEDYK